MVRTNQTIEETIRYYSSLPYQTQARRNYDILIEMIATKAIPEGTDFTEAEIAALIQSGRTPVREALKLLEYDSVIQTVPRLGMHVKKCRVEDYLLQAEVRCALEKVVIRRACSLATEDERLELRKLNEAFRSSCAMANDLETYRVDRLLHELIDRCSRNPYAVHALGPLRFFEQRVHYELGRSYREVSDTLNEEHLLFVEGIINGEPEVACEQFEKMIGRTVELVRRQLREQNQIYF